MKRNENVRFRLRPLLFPAAIIITILIMGAFLLLGPFTSPYGGERPYIAIAVPVGIAIVMAGAIWWIARRRRL